MNAPADPAALAPWLALLRAPGIGIGSFHAILEAYGDPAEIFTPAGLAELPAGAREYLRRTPWEGVGEDLAWAEGEANHILTFADPRYPALLRQIADPPPVLFVHGDPELLDRPQLAIVGSRNPTPAGRETASAFAGQFARDSLIVTSGLALGVDAAAHQGTLDAGGRTIAVTATGLDRVYPARHRDLAHAIASQGALISEFPIGTPPLAEHFPRRNRIISGMSLGVLVVEAALRSGSLITARLAGEQGREVFAIPGSIHNPLAKGCHALIKQGAKLVESAADVLEELGPPARARAPRPSVRVGHAPDLTPDQGALLEMVGDAPTSVDVLVERSGLTPPAVSSMLLVLELQRLVAAAPGGGYIRLHPKA